MFVKTLTIVSGAFACAAFAASVGDLPSCAVDAFANGQQHSYCSVGDSYCICEDGTYSTLQLTLRAQCSGDDLNTALAVLAENCQGVSANSAAVTTGSTDPTTAAGSRGSKSLAPAGYDGLSPTAPAGYDYLTSTIVTGESAAAVVTSAGDDGSAATTAVTTIPTGTHLESAATTADTGTSSDDRSNPSSTSVESSGSTTPVASLYDSSSRPSAGQYSTASGPAPTAFNSGAETGRLGSSAGVALALGLVAAMFAGI